MARQRHDSTKLSAPFRWTARRERAAMLVAEGSRPDEAIAGEAGISRRALAGWKQHPDFQARVQGHVEAMRAAVAARGIAEKRNRVDAIDRRWRKLERVLEARAADPRMADVPGGDTGLLVRTVKWVKRYKVIIRRTAEHGAGEIGEDEGQDAIEARELLIPDGTQLVEEYAIDTGLLTEMLKLEIAAAKEAGQLVERSEITGADGAPLASVVIYLPDNGRDARS